jgi:hypothetical protein
LIHAIVVVLLHYMHTIFPVACVCNCRVRKVDMKHSLLGGPIVAEQGILFGVLKMHVSLHPSTEESLVTIKMWVGDQKGRP